MNSRVRYFIAASYFMLAWLIWNHICSADYSLNCIPPKTHNHQIESLFHFCYCSCFFLFLSPEANHFLHNSGERTRVLERAFCGNRGRSTTQGWHWCHVRKTAYRCWKYKVRSRIWLPGRRRWILFNEGKRPKCYQKMVRHKVSGKRKNQ